MKLWTRRNTDKASKDFYIFSASAVEKDGIPSVVVDGMRMSILSKPVAAMLAEWHPLQPSFIPVWYDPRDVFPVLLMRVWPIVSAVFPHHLYIHGKLEIAIAA